MLTFGRYFLLFLFALGIGGIVYWELRGGHSFFTVAGPAKSGDTTPANAKPSIQFPVDEEKSPGAPSELATVRKGPHQNQAPSNLDTLEASLAGLFSTPLLGSVLRTDELIRNVVIVVTEEGSPRLPSQFLPWMPVKGKFAVNKEGDSFTLSPENSTRYEPYLRALESVSAKRLVGIYVHFYSAFQKAYREAGSPGYFNDKVVAALDDLLNAPEPTPPVGLVRPEVFYRYSDPDLEALSAGQKLMIRLGPENEQRLKKKLRDYRALLTHLGKQVSH